MGIELAIIALKCSEKIYLIEKVLHHQNSGMLKFIIILLLTIILFWVIRYAAIRIVNEKWPELGLEVGKSFFSIKHMKIDNTYFFLETENLLFNFNLLFLLSLSAQPLFSVSFSKFDFELKKLMNFENDNGKAKKKLTLEMWVIQHILLFVLTMILKSISVDLSNIKLVFKKYCIKIRNITQVFRRTSKKIKDEFGLYDLVFIYDEKSFARIPQIRFSLDGNSSILENVLDLSFGNLEIKSEKIELNFVNGDSQISISPINVIDKKDNDINCFINIKPINIDLPKLSLSTKSLSVNVSNLDLSLSETSIQKIDVIRMNNKILEMPNISFCLNKLTIPLVKVKIQYDFLVDIATIIQLLPNQDDKPNQTPIHIPFTIKVCYIEARFCLTDDDGIFILFENGIRTKNDNSISALNLSIKLIVENKGYDFAKASNFSIKLNDQQHINISASKIEVYFSFMYSFYSFLMLFIKSISYILSIIRGFNYVQQLDISPTPIAVSFDIKIIKINFLQKDLADVVNRSNEAKKYACESLIQRQIRAIDIIRSNDNHNFSLEDFEQESKKIRFRLFKEAFRELPTEKNLMTVEISNISAKVDGLAFSSFNDAIQTIEKRYYPLNREEISSLDAINISGNFKKLSVDGLHHGKIAILDSVSFSFDLFLTTPKIHKRFDVYHYILKIEGSEYLVPNESSLGIIFLPVNACIKKLDIYFTPYVLDIFQDFILLLDDFLADQIKYKKTFSLLDILRLQVKVEGIIEIKQINAYVNNSKNSFSQKEFPLKVIISNSLLTLHETKMEYGCESIVVMILQKQFIKVPKMLLEIEINSINDLNDMNDANLFIPVDSSKIEQKHYEPFLKYCTNKISFSLNANFAVSKKSELKINFDPLQDFLLLFLSEDGFITPVDFSKKAKKQAIMSHGTTNIILPPIIISFFNSKFNVRIENDGLGLKFINAETQNLSLTSKLITSSFYIYQNQIGFADIVDLSLQTKDQSFIIKLDNMTTNLSIDIISILLDINFEIPSNKILSKLSPNLELDEIIKILNIDVVSIEAKTVLFHVLFKTCQFSPSICLNGISFKLRKSDTTKASLISVSFDSFLVELKDEMQLISIQNLDLNVAYSDDRLLLFLSSEVGMSIFIRPDIINTILPEIIELIPKKFRVISNNNNAQKEETVSMRISIIIHGAILVGFFSNENVFLTYLSTSNIDFDFRSYDDGGSNLLLTIGNIEAYDERKEQKLNLVLTTSGKGGDKFIKFSFNKRKTMMKYPVYDKVFLKVYQPIIININREFVEEVIENFPSAKDLNIFDVEGLPEQQTVVFDSNSIESYSADSPFGFYGNVKISPISMTISYYSTTGIIKEIKNRRFTYQGNELYDLFGTAEKLKKFIIDQLKWSLIKSLPTIAFGTKES